jgi:hypothetical protein
MAPKQKKVAQTTDTQSRLKSSGPIDVVDFGSLGIGRKGKRYDSLASLAGKTVIIKSVLRKKLDGSPATKPGEGIYVAKLDDGRKFQVSEAKGRQLATAIQVADGKMVRCTVVPNPRRGFSLK